MAGITGFCHKLRAALDDEDGYIAGDLLSLQNAEHVQPLLRTVTPKSMNALPGQCRVAEQYSSLAVAHLKTIIYAFQVADFKSAFDSQLILVKTFKDMFLVLKECNWMLHTLDVVTRDLRLLASRADEQASANGEKAEALESAMSAVRDCFAAISADRADIELSKKWGMMFLVNHLLYIAFKLNNFAILKALLRTVDLSQKYRDDFYISHRVTYSFYVGRKAMFDANYKVAEEQLQFALEHCHRERPKNKRLILIYLIPVNLLLGKLPTDKLLAKYNLSEFSKVTEAVRTGNLLLLTTALAEHQLFFIQWGIYLILEKLRIITYRNLFKKVHLITGDSKLKLPVVLAALHYMKDSDIDLDEAECIVANLIHQGYIKGYIAHQQRVLVLSKKQPFPPLASLMK